MLDGMREQVILDVTGYILLVDVKVANQRGRMSLSVECNEPNHLVLEFQDPERWRGRPRVVGDNIDHVRTTQDLVNLLVEIWSVKPD